MKVFRDIPRQLRSVLASQRFFQITIAVLVIQALWLALSGKYPMAFDEDFHMGIIKLYTHHLSPFWSGHPAGADAYGAVARDPSYLFQWLMSFPYRFISLFTHDEAAIVIVLRFLNIAMFASALPLFRRLLLKTGVSRALVQACLFIFVLLPVVPLLAAQVNYDNLVMPVLAALLLLTLRIRRELLRGQLPLRDLAILLGAGMLASLIKYAFLPIFVAMLAYTAVMLWRAHSRQTFKQALGSAWRTMHVWTRLGLAALLVVAAILFVERYGINVIKYHNPIPDCGDVLTVNQCISYGPWGRDYAFNQGLVSLGQHVSHNPFAYTMKWFYGMWLRTFFAVAGPDTVFDTKGPLFVPAFTAATVGILAFTAALFKARTLWRRYDRSVISLFLAILVAYLASLWLTEYKEFLYTGQPVAINGRYLVPVALLIMVLAAAGLYELVRHRPRLLSGIVVITVVGLLWGGGMLTYILRANDNWYWNNRVIRSVNATIKHTLGPVTPGYNYPNKFLN